MSCEIVVMIRNVSTAYRMMMYFGVKWIDRIFIYNKPQSIRQEAAAVCIKVPE